MTAGMTVANLFGVPFGTMLSNARAGMYLWILY